MGDVVRGLLSGKLMRGLLVLILVWLAGCVPRLGQNEVRQTLEGFLFSQQPAFGLADF